MADNIDIFDFALTEEEMARINARPQKPYYVVLADPPAFATRHTEYSQQARTARDHRPGHHHAPQDPQ